MDQVIVEFMLDESKWLFTSMLLSKRAVGWTIVTVAIAGNLALFLGSLVFLASGQSFEQFQGRE